MRSVLSFAMILTLAAPAAWAQPQPQAPSAASFTEIQSRSLFMQARALAAEGKWAAACPLFQQAHDLNATGGTALQLANCYERTEQLDKARVYYRFILDHRADEKVTERITIAEERLAALEPKTPDPVPTPDPVDEGGAARTAGIVMVGAGGVGLAVGTIFGVLALAQAGDVKDRCVDSVCPTDQRAEADAAMTKGWVSTVAFGVGIVAVTTGALLLLINRPSPAAAARRPPAILGRHGLAVRF